MNLFSDLYTTVQSDLSVGNESTLFGLDKVKAAVNRAYHKGVALYLWPETEDAKKTTTQELVDYYDYPATWRPDSIWKLMIDDVDFGDPLSFKDYQYEKENIEGNILPCGKDRIWTSQWRRYFMYPAPTEAGLEIVVWGQTAVEDMVDDEDITIWSYSMPECNEGIVKEAVAILRAKGDDVKIGKSGNTIGNLLSIEAQIIFATAWGKIKQNQEKYKSTQPEYDIPDFFE